MLDLLPQWLYATARACVQGATCKVLLAADEDDRGLVGRLAS